MRLFKRNVHKNLVGCKYCNGEKCRKGERMWYLNFRGRAMCFGCLFEMADSFFDGKPFSGK